MNGTGSFDNLFDELERDGGLQTSETDPTEGTMSTRTETFHHIPIRKSIDMDIDLVFVIDATGSMHRFWDKAKAAALDFMNGLEVALKEHRRKVRNVSVRVIAFRDYYFDAEPMRTSRFFDLRDLEDKREFSNFINSIEPMGGGDEPESGLEALYEAIHSRWPTERVKNIIRRQVIVLITDASAHELNDSRRYSENLEYHPTLYPAYMLESIEELAAEWNDSQIMNATRKCLLLYTPKTTPWDWVGCWPNASLLDIQDGAGGAEIEMNHIFACIAGCC